MNPVDIGPDMVTFSAALITWAPSLGTASWISLTNGCLAQRLRASLAHRLPSLSSTRTSVAGPAQIPSDGHAGT